MRLRIGIVSGDLMLVSRLLPTLKEAGHHVTAGANVSEIEAALVDIGPTAYPDWARRIRLLKEAGVAVVAFGPHEDTMRLARAKGLGADLVTINSLVLRDPASVVRSLVKKLGSEGDAQRSARRPDDDGDASPDGGRR